MGKKKATYEEIYKGLTVLYNQETEDIKRFVGYGKPTKNKETWGDVFNAFKKTKSYKTSLARNLLPVFMQYLQRTRNVPTKKKINETYIKCYS